MPTINAWLQHATHTLTGAGIGTARLDALVLAAHILGRDKAWLLAHDNDELTTSQQSLLDEALNKRAQRIPLAYLVGYKEFFGRDFNVNSAVLIPRPETETLIELLATLALPKNAQCIDVGTGSGAIAITAKLEHPAWEVWASDIDTAALTVAVQNAARLGAAIHLLQNDLLESSAAKETQSLPATPFDVIVANLPYVAADATTSPETAHEPHHALYAEHAGLSLINKLIAQTPKHLAPHGYLLLEAEPTQHAAIIAHAKSYGLRPIDSRDFILVLAQA